MKISFLVTYFNQKKYVEQSIKSILAIEKPCDWEIIVGDDGSTDGTIEEVEKFIRFYPDKIKLFIMPRELGKTYDAVKRASANRLNILEQSTGDIFCTLDGDDFFCDKNFVRDAINIFKKDKNISVIVFGFRYYCNGLLGKEITLPEKEHNHKVCKNLYLEKFYIHAGGCVHKKSFPKSRIDYIKKIGFFDDNNIVINSLKYGDAFSVNRAIYAYRQTGNSIYTSMNEFEQAVLNVQGLDVDLRLIGKESEDIILHRYSKDFILIFIWKEYIKSILGELKFMRYKDGCSSLMPSYCYNLLNYPNIDNNTRKRMNYIFRVLANKNIKFTLKKIIKFLSWRLLSK